MILVRHLESLRKLIEHYQADIWFFNGAINHESFKLLRKKFYEIEPRENSILILTTSGGSAHSAYQIAMFFKNKYKNNRVLVVGRCKSAGTLIAIAADEVVMFDMGELGPLDVQIARTDDIGARDSGIDIIKGLDVIRDQSFKIFENAMVKVKAKSGGTVTMKMAAEIGTALSNGIMSEIASQIDPLRLGAISRAASIAEQYGKSLGIGEKLIKKLIHDYPSHSCVIDLAEAKRIRIKAREPLDIEIEVESTLVEMFKQQGEDAIYEPVKSGYVLMTLDSAKKSAIKLEDDCDDLSLEEGEEEALSQEES